MWKENGMKKVQESRIQSESGRSRYPEIDDFIAYLRLKNLAPRTIREYEHVIRNLFRALKPPVESPTEVTTAQLRRYIASLQERGLAPKTVGFRVMVLKRFYRFLFDEGYIDADPSRRIPSPKVGKRLPKSLATDQIQKFFASFNEEVPIERRDKIFFELVYLCGLRMSEACNIRVEDLDLDDSSLTILGKGSKERKLYLKPQLTVALKSYLEDQERGFLFPGYNGGPITTRQMGYRFKVYADRAGLPETATPHSFRHSIAVHYLMNGAPITFVQRLLGHASLATTGIYTQLTDRLARDVTLQIPTALDRPIG